MIQRLLSFFAGLWKHLYGHREFYAYLPIGILLLTGGMRYVGFITERDVTEDVGAIIPALIFLVFELLLFAVIGFVQEHLIGYRSEKEHPTWAEEVFDAVNFWLLFFGLNLCAYKALMPSLT
jgi:hypothetical protein